MTSKLSAAGRNVTGDTQTLGSTAALGSGDAALDKLYELKLQKIKEQKDLSDRMNEILTKHGGLNENSKLTRKSLQAAIAVAKQPG